MSKKLRLLSALPILSVISGCVANTTAPVAVHDYCELVYPITYDTEHDTDPTIKEIEKHNSVYVCICENDCPKGVK